MRTFVAALLSMLFASCATAKPQDLPRDCIALLDRTVPGWKTLVPDRDVSEWAKSKKLNPVVTGGDFDGNKTQDWATIGFIDGKSKVVLCLSKPTGKTIVIAEDGGCSDLIYTIKRKTKVPNLESGREEILRTDTVATSCF
jgi:hypothetical protein